MKLLTKKEWAEVWEQLDIKCDQFSRRFQSKMSRLHGYGHYYRSPEEQWEDEKKILQRLVTAKLKEKNHGV